MFRGVAMKPEWLEPWIEKVGANCVCIPGNTSCSQNLRVAIGFAIPEHPKPDFTSVLFVISCKNYESPAGIRMNNEAYTSFPVEREILLVEGCGVWVLEVEENVIIDNNHADFSRYNGKVITIVHLFTQ